MFYAIYHSFAKFDRLEEVAGRFPADLVSIVVLRTFVVPARCVSTAVLSQESIMRVILDRSSNILVVRVLLIAFASAVPVFAAAPARAGFLYESGFESPRFKAGQTVNGQGDFSVTSPSNPAAFVVTTTNPYAGSQTLEGIGSQLTSQQTGLVQSTAGVTLNYDASASNGQIVVLSAQMELSGPSTNTGHGTADDLVSMNLEAILGDGSYFSTYLSSDGKAYGYTTGYDFAAKADLGVYHEVALILDFSTRTCDFVLDGTVFGIEKFDPSVQSTVVQSAQFTFYSSVEPAANPADYTAYADNFAVENLPAVVPEPSSITLSLVGLGLVGIHLRRRNRTAARSV
jgi:hypothetical protein